METTPQQEIERKWLLKNMPRNIFYDQKINIEQWYVKMDGKDCRIRISVNLTGEDYRLEVIHKENIGYGHNIEHHYNITRAEASEILVQQPGAKFISKTRHVKNFDGYKIEIDEFKDMKLIMMEVEVPHIEFPIVFDQVITDVIVTEVTGNPAFNNYSLA